MKIEKIEPAGYKVSRNEQETYYLDEYGQFGYNCNLGCIYKNQKAFETGKEVCYISEYSFEGSINEIFTEEELEELDKKGVSKATSYAISGYTREDLISLCNDDAEEAESLFNHLDWQLPETLFNEWCDDEEEFDE